MADYALQLVGNFGVSILRTSAEQAGFGREIAYEEMEPGDLVCYPGHVAMYIGGGRIVHARSAKAGNRRLRRQPGARSGKRPRFSEFRMGAGQKRMVVPECGRNVSGEQLAVGKVSGGWHQQGDDWYYMNPDGSMAVGWIRHKDAWYYLGDDGAMCTGQVTVDGKWYVMDNAGRMIVEPVTLTPDQDGALQWPGLAR